MTPPLMEISILFFFLNPSLSNHKANTTELHPKVRKTCFVLIFSLGRFTARRCARPRRRPPASVCPPSARAAAPPASSPSTASSTRRMRSRSQRPSSSAGSGQMEFYTDQYCRINPFKPFKHKLSSKHCRFKAVVPTHPKIAGQEGWL